MEWPLLCNHEAHRLGNVEAFAAVYMKETDILSLLKSSCLLSLSQDCFFPRLCLSLSPHLLLVHKGQGQSSGSVPAPQSPLGTSLWDLLESLLEQLLAFSIATSISSWKLWGRGLDFQIVKDMSVKPWGWGMPVLVEHCFRCRSATFKWMSLWEIKWKRISSWW